MNAGVAELQEAAVRVGLVAEPLELVRHGSNSIYRLPDGVIARLGPRSGCAAAAKEVAVAAWLQRAGIDAVRPLAGIMQPTLTPGSGRPVTWWHELPAHRPATPAELGHVLASLHQLPLPDEPSLPELQPLTSFSARIRDARSISQPDRDWLLHHLEQIQRRWCALPPSGTARQLGVIHGDAWQGNVAALDNGRLVLLDLEHVAIGLAEWDLTAIAVDHTDFARVDHATYQSFVDAYGGYDVTTWPGYRTLADIWELRWVCFALTRANYDHQAEIEAEHRIACLHGDIARPWTWNPL